LCCFIREWSSSGIESVMLGMSFLRIYYVDRHIYVFLQMLFAGPFSGNAGAEKSKPGLPA
jgi:hypothetical protein